MANDSAEFLDRLQATFVVEAAEHCQVMSTSLLDLENAPEDRRQAVIERIFRAAHSLKGAARAVNHSPVESVCQRLESVFDSWKRRRSTPRPASFDVLHRAIECARTLAPASGANLDRAAKDLDLLFRDIAGIASDSAPAQPPELISPSPAPVGGPASAPPINERPELVPLHTVRVPVAKIEALLYAAEELLTLKATLAQRSLDVRQAMEQFDQLRHRWAEIRIRMRDVQSDDSAARDGTADVLAPNHDTERLLEQKFVALGRAIERDRHTLNKTVDHLLDETKMLLLLPFATDAGFYAKLVRDLARDQGKQVEFVFRGGEVEVDKRILEGMKDPLVHLLRNAVDHGMETPDARAASGKPARGTITLHASRVDDRRVQILISDDGAGIDVAAVRNAAVSLGVMTRDAAAGLSDADALRLIFRSELSTARHVTEVSGRGVGLAIVQESIDRLDGRVLVQSERGRGTSFRIVLPAAQDTFRAILASVGDHVFALPATKVQRVLRVPVSDVRMVENRATIMVEQRAVAFVRLGDVLNLPQHHNGTAASPMQEIVLLGPVARSIAFAVDGVLQEADVLVKPLREPLRRVRNIAGATVLGSGRVVLILDVADLLESAIAASASPVPARAESAQTEARRRSILVAEDSITSRMLLKNILESAGYTVRTAIDGLDAITVLRSEPCDLVVSDVEMPRMNGFGLTQAIRADRKLAEIPVILVTALATREDRERGIDAGANAYIVKSNFEQSDLLAAVERLL